MREVRVEEMRVVRVKGKEEVESGRKDGGGEGMGLRRDGEWGMRP